jgi:hypothetical protein
MRDAIESKQRACRRPRSIAAPDVQRDGAGALLHGRVGTGYAVRARGAAWLIWVCKGETVLGPRSAKRIHTSMQ